MRAGPATASVRSQHGRTRPNACFRGDRARPVPGESAGTWCSQAARRVEDSERAVRHYLGRAPAAVPPDARAWHGRRTARRPSRATPAVAQARTEPTTTPGVGTRGTRVSPEPNRDVTRSPHSSSAVTSLRPRDLPKGPDDERNASAGPGNLRTTPLPVRPAARARAVSACRRLGTVERTGAGAPRRQWMTDRWP